MSVLKKSVIAIFSIFALLLLILFIAYTVFVWKLTDEIFIMAPNYNKADKFLNENYDELTCTANELLQTEYEYIEITTIPSLTKNGYTMKVKTSLSGYEELVVPDNLINHIKNLENIGIKRISVREDYVSFTLWSVFDDIRKIRYSVNGEVPSGEQLIEIRELSKKNWYYYVNNFEKAKECYPERFK